MTASRTSSPAIPGNVGPYRILGRLGIGGMGAVYKAFDERLHREVAIKHILPELGDDSSRQRLRREAQAAAGLNHPSIVQIYDIFDSTGVDWIVMELVEGVTLKSLIDDGRLGLSEAVSLSREIAEGLAEAHRKGIVHRDLKTENIMVTRSLHAKILDFGLAKQMRQDLGEITLTGLGQVLGTGRAMSPEQAMGEDVDHRSDLFSLGTLIFEAVTRRSPFSGTSAYNTLTRVCSVPHVAACEVNRFVPVELSNLIDRLLEKNPEHRPQSAREVVVELRVIEKQPLPEWGGLYAPTGIPETGSSDSHSNGSSDSRLIAPDGAPGQGSVDAPAFVDLDPAKLPGPEAPPLAANLAELVAVAQIEPTFEPPRLQPEKVDATSLTEEVTAYIPTVSEASQVKPRFHDGLYLKAILAIRLEGEGGGAPGHRGSRHFDEELRRLALELEGQRLSRDEVQLLIFERPLLAMRCALDCQRFVERRNEGPADGLRLRMGLHLGEVMLTATSSRLEALGSSLDVARDLSTLAWPGQALLTPEVHSLSRRSLRERPLPGTQPRWHSHGRFYLDRLEEAVELWALSASEERSRLLPHDGPRARRLGALPAGAEETAPTGDSVQTAKGSVG